jgi:hypothetical protein
MRIVRETGVRCALRKYTLAFMEQKIGVPRLTPIPGPEGEASFEASDDDEAIGQVRQHFADRLQTCVRGELSSMALVRDASGAARFVDDSLENPHFQETYIRYDVRTKQIEVDFVSTATSLLPPAYKRSG